MDVYLEEIVLFSERIINITKSMGNIVVLYQINTLTFYTFLYFFFSTVSLYNFENKKNVPSSVLYSYLLYIHFYIFSHSFIFFFFFF